LARVTLRTIAEDTGLSKFAVSRALAGKSGISDATRERVVKAAGRLGYRKPAIRSKRAIGVIFDDTDMINSELHMQVQSGVRQEARDLGFDVRMHWTHNLDEFGAFAADNAGLVIVGPHSRQSLHHIYATGTPAVRVGWLDPLERVDLVSGTDHEAGSAVAQYLCRLGHRNIAYVHGTPRYRGRMERLFGLREILERNPEARLHDLTWEENADFVTALTQLRADGTNPTAYF